MNCILILKTISETFWVQECLEQFCNPEYIPTNFMYLIILLTLLLSENVSDERAEDFSSYLLEGDNRFEEKLEEGIRYFYNTDWIQSGKIFRELAEEAPYDPRPIFFESMKPFLEYFFIDQSDELADEFLAISSKAIELSEKRLDSVRDDTTMVLMLSGMHGYRGLVAAGQNRHRIALGSGLTGFNYTRKLLSLGSDRPDARIGRGMFYYMVGSIPSGMRWASNIIGLRAEVDDGFNELKQAAETDSYIRNDALMMLMYLYEREERFEEALHYAEVLTSELPDNVIFQFKKAEILELTGNKGVALNVYRDIVSIDNQSLPRVTEKSRKKVEELQKNL